MKKTIEFVLVGAFCLLSWPYVYQKYWHWFIEKTFDFRHLTYKECMGLYFFVYLLRVSKSYEIKDEYKKKDPVYYYCFFPVIYFLIGYFGYIIIKYLPF